MTRFLPFCQFDPQILSQEMGGGSNFEPPQTQNCALHMAMTPPPKHHQEDRHQAQLSLFFPKTEDLALLYPLIRDVAPNLSVPEWIDWAEGHLTHYQNCQNHAHPLWPQSLAALRNEIGYIQGVFYYDIRWSADHQRVLHIENICIQALLNEAPLLHTLCLFVQIMACHLHCQRLSLQIKPALARLLPTSLLRKIDDLATQSDGTPLSDKNGPDYYIYEIDRQHFKCHSVSNIIQFPNAEHHECGPEEEKGQTLMAIHKKLDQITLPVQLA